MTKAYTLIRTDIGSQIDVLNSLMMISEVKEAHKVYGVHDVIARVEAGTMEELKDAIKYRIRNIDNVRATLIMICLREASIRDESS